MTALFKSWNDHDVNKLTSLFSDSSVYEVVNTAGVFTAGRKLPDVKLTFSGLPDTRLIIMNMITTDSIGVVEWVWKGTNSVGWPHMGISATNKYFGVRGVSVVKIENGSITQNRDYWDWNTFIKGISD